MPRSAKKGFFVQHNLQKKVDKATEEGAKPGTIKTNSRGSMITPQMVGLTIAVHNGKTYVPIVIRAEWVGDKLGEYVPTRVVPKHPTDRKTG